MDGYPAILPVDVSKITERVKYSWYADADNDKNPSESDTIAQYPKGQRLFMAQGRLAMRERPTRQALWHVKPSAASIPMECR